MGIDTELHDNSRIESEGTNWGHLRKWPSTYPQPLPLLQRREGKFELIIMEPISTPMIKFHLNKMVQLILIYARLKEH